MDLDLLNARFKNSVITRADCPSFVGDNDLPIWFEKANGAFLYTVDNREFIDLCNGKGSVLLGHNDRSVNEAISQSLSSNCVTGPSPILLDVAEMIVNHTGKSCSAAFYPTGTEALRAVATSLRDSYQSTDSILLSAGWHGWDPMWRYGKRLLEPNSDGVIDFFFVPELMEVALKKYGSKCTAVFISPDPNYVTSKTMKDLLLLARKFGVTIVCDDVKHGYRWRLGCSLGLFNEFADITIYSKGLSNGRRVAGVVSTRDVASPLRHLTYTNIFETSVLFATKTTLQRCMSDDFYKNLSMGGDLFISRFREITIPFRNYVEISGSGQLFQLIFSSDELATTFYKLALKNGLIFYAFDNQMPSASFNTLIADRAIKICERVLNEMESSSCFKSELPIDDKRRFMVAWRQMDGASDLFNLNQVSLIEEMLFPS